MTTKPTFLLRCAAVSALAALLAPLSQARPVSAKEAATAAANWLSRNPRPLGAEIPGASAAGVRTVEDGDGGALFHAVRIEGGGLVVLSADTSVEPVVAFADADELPESPDHPLRALLAADLALRAGRARLARDPEEGEKEAKKTGTDGAKAKSAAASDPFAAAEAAWDELLSGPAPAAKGGLSSLPDIRVSPLIQSRWGQSGGAANYYTPPYTEGDSRNHVCGCVSLAGAQIARYWQFPKDSRPAVTRPCSVQGLPGDYQTFGGTYDWNAMPLFFAGLNDVQKKAIGKLCHDFGVATYMDWGSGGSGTQGFCLDEAFTDVFGFANSRVYVDDDGSSVPDGVVERAVFANLDARCPVSLGIAGHMVDADGYGFAGGLAYTHLNMGWEGSGDAWYNLPDVDAGNGYVSTVLRKIVYNVFPEKTGDLLTGRVLDLDGVPVANAQVRAASGSSSATATTDAKGIYAFWVEGGRTWNLSASAAGGTASASVYVTNCVSATVVGLQHFGGPGVVGNRWGVELRLGVSISSPPAAPTGLAASQGTRADRIRLSWNPAPGSLSYAVFRATSATGTRTRVATCSGTSFDDTSAVPGSHFWYWVAGENFGGTGDSGGPAEGWCADDADVGTFADGLDATQLSWTTSPGAPWTFAEDVSHDEKDSAKSGNVWTNKAPSLTWIETQVDGPAQVSFVYRKVFASGCFSTEVDGEEQLSDNKQAINDTTWYSAVFELGEGLHVIRLSYEHGGGSIGSHNGVWVDEFDVAPPGGFAPPAPVVSFADQNTVNEAVRVFWQPSKLAKSYTVYRADCDDVGAAVPIEGAESTMGNFITFSDATATPGTTNWYWVVAVNDAGSSAYGGPVKGWRKVVAVEDPVTRTTPVPVPHSWLDGFPGGLAAHDWDYEAFANSFAANGVERVWECYVTGVSPTNAAQRFLAEIVFENGIPAVTWTPDLGHARVYAVEGKATLTNDWGGTNSASRFFRVRVAPKE